MTTAMDFFGHQDQARKRTGLLVFYFGAAVLTIILAIYAAIAVGLNYAELGIRFQYGVWNTELFLGIAAVVSLIVFAGTSYKVSQLSGSAAGMRVASSLGGTQVNADTTDPDERRLLNVVEEMAIASGTPVPPVYVLDEDSINAFAAGHTPTDAVVAVTRGAMRVLSRDELQGVIAHEFSHILNGDMRLNIRLMSILHGIIVIAIIGTLILRVLGRGGGTRSRSSSKSGKGGGGAIILVILVVGITFTVIGYIGEFFARMIQMAVSREREFLADASAVQFTRNPQGIGGALKKIGGHADGSKVMNANAKTVSHLFLADGIRTSFSGLFSTHPELGSRIRRIDPSWDGAYPAVALPSPAAKASPAHPAAGLVGGATGAVAGQEPVFEVRLRPESVLERVGTVAPEQVAMAGALIDSMPSRLVELAHDPFGARAVVCGLLLEREQSLREKQLAALKGTVEQGVTKALDSVLELVSSLSMRQRLPLLELTLPSLRRLSASQWRDFLGLIDVLIQADSHVSVFEFVLRLLVRRQAQLAAGELRTHVSYTNVQSVIPETVALLSTLAWFGVEHDAARARESFAKGAERLSVRSFTLRPQEFSTLDLAALERALETLSRCSHMVKRQLLDACVACVAADERVGINEAELLRAIGSALDCPIPPFAPTVARD
jgi:Zn-dependent protease with chaperone function